MPRHVTVRPGQAQLTVGYSVEKVIESSADQSAQNVLKAIADGERRMDGLIFYIWHSCSKLKTLKFTYTLFSPNR